MSLITHRFYTSTSDSRHRQSRIYGHWNFLAGTFLMASQYTSALPAVPIDPAIPKFFENFYHISDTPDAHDRFADSFTEDATIVASKTAVGREGWSLILYSAPPNICFPRRHSLSGMSSLFVHSSYSMPSLSPCSCPSHEEKKHLHSPSPSLPTRPPTFSLFSPFHPYALTHLL